MMNAHPTHKWLVFNFHVSVWLSIVGGIAVFNVPDLILPDTEELYGPLRNNFLIIIGYLVVSQVGLWYFRYLRGGHFEALLMAYTFLATAVGAEFYGRVNGLPIAGVFPAVLLYLGFSHGLYYAACRPTAGAQP